ncbi:MAG: F0F1 ATP synthase subunit B [Eubacteriales bacterium]
MSIVIDAFESFVGVNVWTMIFAWCNLLILYFFLKKLLFVPIKKMIDQRQKEVDDMYENAERAELEAKEMRSSYEQKLNSANEESEEILKTAVRRAQLKEEEILRDAQSEASRIYERAEEQIALEKKRALSEVKDEVSGMAVEIAGALIEREVSAEEHAQFIDSFIDSVGD